jgi:D-alanine-D-alanine ligase
VAVVFGGRSSEHAISCVSAGSVLANLDRERFDVLPVGITPDGGWVLAADDPAALRISGTELPAVSAPTSAAVVLPGDPTRGGLVLLDPARAGQVFSGVDVVFPVLHGPFGEDGTIQGLLEMAGVPYVGPGVLASAAGMDKEFTKKLLAADRIPVGPLVVLRRGEEMTAEDRERLGLPVFVKPARAGSSVGITRVTDWDDLAAAIADARRHDPKVLVEAAIPGREIECGVLEFPDGSVRASVPAEIRIVGSKSGGTRPEFYDFDAKYLEDVCEFDVPAKVDDEVAERLRELAVRAFRALDCQGLARVDFFLGPDGALTVNEVNTMPGFTSISMYPRMWAVTGVDYPTLLGTLIETAVARGTGLR